MATLRIYFALLAFCAAAQAESAQPTLFHGTSVVIFPSHDTPSPVNSTLQAANFFCYMTDEGYLSFGWSVPPTIHGNTSHCRPDSVSYHWYEYAIKDSCDDEAETCQYSTQNVPVRKPAHADPLPFPSRPLQYVIQPVDVGNRGYGQMAVSYIDDGPVMVYGVGTRQVLSGKGESESETFEDCTKAYGTLRRIYDTYKPPLPFELRDPCSSLDRQAILDEDGAWAGEL